MNNEPNKNDDIIDLTEIEKIQAEIARDLELADSLQFSLTPPSPPPQPVPTYAMPEQKETTHFVSTPPVKQVSWLRRLVLVCIVCTLGTASFGFAFGWVTTWLSGRNQEATPLPAAAYETPNPVTTTRYAFELPEGTMATLADMIELVSASVVSLTTLTAADNSDGIRPRRNGTGVIFAEDNENILIVTSHYVVRLGNDVIVRFACGGSVRAHPFAHDIDIDLSVIAVRKNDLVEQGITDIVLATFGDSSAMRMGETVIALGNARGEGISVTRGIVSAEEQIVRIPALSDRRPPDRRRMLDLYTIQTDASINYGDSGGPLINTRGEVIGVIVNVSALLFGENSLAEGIGHSISSNHVQPVLYDLANRLRPAIGIVGVDLSGARAVELGIPDIGVYIDRVMVGFAAYLGGMLSGDVITGFNDRPVLDMDQLQAEIAKMRPGDIVEVRILRDGEAMVLELELQPRIFDTF